MVSKLDYDRIDSAVYCKEDSLTVQSSKDEVDINLIVARALNGGDVSHINERVAKYGDFSNVPSYQDALELVKRAQGMFSDLDAKVRERFGNNPTNMVNFLADNANYDEAVKLGLVVAKPPVETKEPVQPASPPPGGGQAG